ncbi:hypothetical protein ASPVEDRAFT_55016 [Aspergillus versicolor CBS 583.65]|uniref:Signal peptide peptidase n=1 Tax=Aspergillus versicolor CBS 583.65 TaxID=1036611 RepID=A0A1L9PTV1_ASPVE|nr:uncharacterized protein ASPVEDRAFT_55016 [Aspergillus versicolor CBS 583.65]OJJ04957.1 hypothetical protein ASPVEDRAFT_55016 [Aspergillus versicolor CBS 583.65]
MAEVSPLAELLGQALYQFTLMKPMLPTYGHVIASALFLIYIGAHASLSRPNSAAKPPKSDKDAQSESEDEEEEEECQNDDNIKEGLSPGDAIMFPLTAGATLGGLYLIIKWKGAELLNKILGFYFSQIGIFFAMAFVKDALSVLRSFVFPRKYTSGGRTWKPRPSERIFSAPTSSDASLANGVRQSPLPGVFGSIPLPLFVLKGLWACRAALYWRAKLRVHIHRILHFESSLSAMDILSGILSLPAVAYFAFISKPWWLTNFLGFSFCYGSLQLMSPSTFVTGSLILGSLFFYDIYFVYFTPLMVTVATKLDVPVKLLFPRPSDPTDPAGAVSLSMLGLGDIVIPGMMMGLALRFDLYLYYKAKGALKSRLESEDSGVIKPTYQSATGGWGERFWAPETRSSESELEPPYRDARSFPKTYFKASIVGYSFGMTSTLAVMQIFNHAQPALLYLVPGVVISLWGTALVKGQIREMWEFDDAEDEDEDANKKNSESRESSSDHSRGLFARIFSSSDNGNGSKNSDEVSDKKDNTSETPEGKAGKTEEKSETNDKEKPQSDDKSENAKTLDLFSVSIYVPRKAGSQNPESKGGTAESVPDDEHCYVGVGKQDNEPPTKRRRRSPRIAASPDK